MDSIHPMASPTVCLVSIEYSYLTVTSDCSCLAIIFTVVSWRSLFNRPNTVGSSQSSTCLIIINWKEFYMKNMNDHSYLCKFRLKHSETVNLFTKYTIIKVWSKYFCWYLKQITKMQREITKMIFRIFKMNGKHTQSENQNANDDVF